MRTYVVVLHGTNTRDVRRFEVDAENEDEVRRICADERPFYRVQSIAVQETGGGEGLHPNDPPPPAAGIKTEADRG